MASSGSESGSEVGTDSAPLVGLSTYVESVRFGVWDGLTATLLPRTYPDAVLAAGGLPVLLPSQPGAVPAVDRVDALVITGGPDVDPARYGAPAHPRTGAPRPERDAAEAAMLVRALARGIPVLAVCRGHQLLNVALGGTLVQHLPDVLGDDTHNPRPGVFGTVEIALRPGSRVAAALGPTVTAQCHHHQAIERLADGLVVTGQAADGTVEAVESADHSFLVGVQWHPEQDDPRLFTALVDAAREQQGTSRVKERT